MSLMDELDALIAEAKDTRKKEREHAATPATRITAPSWEPKTVCLFTREYKCVCGSSTVLPAHYGVIWEHPTYGKQVHMHNRPSNWMELPRAKFSLEPIMLYACETCFSVSDSMPYIESELPRAGKKQDDFINQPVDVLDLLGE